MTRPRCRRRVRTRTRGPRRGAEATPPFVSRAGAGRWGRHGGCVLKLEEWTDSGGGGRGLHRRRISVRGETWKPELTIAGPQHPSTRQSKKEAPFQKTTKRNNRIGWNRTECIQQRPNRTVPSPYPGNYPPPPPSSSGREAAETKRHVYFHPAMSTCRRPFRHFHIGHTHTLTSSANKTTTRNNQTPTTGIEYTANRPPISPPPRYRQVALHGALIYHDA